MPEFDTMTIQEHLISAAAGAILGFVVLEIFYKQWMISCVGAFICTLTAHLFTRPLYREKKRQQLAVEFKDALYFLSASLRAGHSLEGAFESVVADMTEEAFPVLYPYWNRMLSGLKLNRRLEDMLYEFADRSEIDEIISFAQIISVSKRTEGDVTKIVESTVRLIRDKIEMRQELSVILAEKKVEQRVMNVMPFVIIGLLTSMSPDYVAPLYGTIQGRIVMTAALLLSVFSMILSAKLSRIPM